MPEHFPNNWKTIENPTKPSKEFFNCMSTVITENRKAGIPRDPIKEAYAANEMVKTLQAARDVLGL